MSLFESPPVKLAKRILQKHSLQPPIDIQALIKNYADLIFKSFPSHIEGVDGVAINIKVPGKRPLVVINENVSITRQRFTMAHELAHLIIPWHTGIRFDEPQLENSVFNSPESQYYFLENEANSFAAELLMPSLFIQKLTANGLELATTHKEISRQLIVSPMAAARKMAQILPPGIIYCVVNNGIVQSSGKTEATLVDAPNWKEPFQYNNYPSYKMSTWAPSTGVEYYWWQNTIKVEVTSTNDIRSWREILDNILFESYPDIETKKIKLRLSGIIGSLNSKLGRTVDYTLEVMLGVCYERFSNPEFKALKSHKDFHVFLQKRLKEMIEKNTELYK